MLNIGVSGICITEKKFIQNHRKLKVLSDKANSYIVQGLNGEKVRVSKDKNEIKPNITIRFDENGVILMGQVYYEIESKDFANLVLLDSIKTEIESKLNLMQSLLITYESIEK